LAGANFTRTCLAVLSAANLTATIRAHTISTVVDEAALQLIHLRLLLCRQHFTRFFPCANLRNLPIDLQLVHPFERSSRRFRIPITAHCVDQVGLRTQAC
jgi:hypothetical protein